MREEPRYSVIRSGELKPSLTLFEICSRLTMKHGLNSSRQTISQHLDVLESAGLVTTRRESRYRFHHLDTTPPKKRHRTVANRIEIKEAR
jgi:DNA-binding transcriptional ArsR family regulator